MWYQTYTPLAGSLGLSALVAALPIFTLLLLLGVLRKPAWIASLVGLAAAFAVAFLAYRMPPGPLLSATAYGAAFGLLPIGWVVFWAVALYRLTAEAGKFDVIKSSIGGLTTDQRLQALLIAFAFGAFIEGAAGFSTPVAVAAAMLTGLGFSPFYAAGLCLLANTAPVAYGSIGTPLITLQAITGLPLSTLSKDVGRICAPVSLFIPAYLVLVMGGWSALRGVLPAAAVCGVSFATAQFLVSNYIGPMVTDIIASLCAILALVALLSVWRPADVPPQENRGQSHSPREIVSAWAPYGLLVLFVLLWGSNWVKTWLDLVTIKFPWPGLDGLIARIPPVVPKPAPYAAQYSLNLLSASGTACMFATISAALVLRMSPVRFAKVIAATLRQLFLSLVTIAAVLALAFLMNYCGATATLGLAFAATGAAFPFFSAMLGWLGVFLTGSDTSSNALFGNLQVVTANSLHLKPALMAAANSSGGVMGKMISVQSIAIAAAATSMATSEEAKLFRFTLRHSILLASVIGLVVLVYSYVLPQWAL